MNQDKPTENKSNITKGYVPSFDLNEDGFYEEKDIYYPEGKFIDMPEETKVKKKRSKKPKHEKPPKKKAEKPTKPEKTGRRYKEKKKKKGKAYKFFLILSILIIIIPVGLYFLGCMYLDRLEKEAPDKTLIEQEYVNQQEIQDGSNKKDKTTLSEEAEKIAAENVEKHEAEEAKAEREALYEEEAANSDYIYYVTLSDGTELSTKSETQYNDWIAKHKKEGDLSYYHWMWDYDDNQYTRGEDNSEDEEPPERLEEGEEL